ncbi:AraC family transcriptional regulator [Actinoplanes sp. KI2]|uniref:helix-turn-helix domain-containing protein n=1 Tax=Actinoplanes sp. KI2 TaxID=2983315 RepID=UPI0021D5ED4C|nr:AraC family transcriptional regulator [Actinoplanes sp. KI2]MCU7722823.1 AraC family transcriptional regulator [Actinoplanes sp. KI2]
MGQTYRERPPIPALAGFVSSTWVQDVPPEADPYVHRSIPTGGAEIVCRSSLSIVGPSTGPRVETLAPGTTVVGLRLRPGVAGVLLGVPASELVDVTVDAAAVWGSAATRVADAAGPEDAVAAVQAVVRERVAASAGVDPVVAEAVRRLMPGRTPDVRSLWSSLGLAERSFRRLCRSAIGLGPKTLHRMLRFQGFLALVQYALARGRTPGEEGLARLAADAGYADQAHLTRECVRLTGVTPRAFLRDVTRSCGHGHDHEVSFAPLAVLVKNGGPGRP